MRSRDLLSLLGGAFADPYFDLEVWDAFGPSRLTLDERDTLAELADPAQTVFLAPTVRDGADGEPVSWCLPIELDGPSAIRALSGVKAVPTIVHAYEGGTALALWSLNRCLEADELARLTRGLSSLLGLSADPRALLRVPTLTLTNCNPPGAASSPCGRVYAPSDLTLFEVGATPVPRNTRRVAAIAARRGDDPLRDIPTATYVRVLADCEPPTCPLHAGEQATLHVDEIAGAPTGFYCSLCEREGSIYDFAAYLWGWTSPGGLTGARFYALQRRLLEVFARHYGEAAA